MATPERRVGDLGMASAVYGLSRLWSLPPLAKSQRLGHEHHEI
jgi:hypothetical protein